MAKDMKAAAHASGPGDGKMAPEPKAPPVGDLCRCKETAIMKPRQLLRLMLDDLSFWKKTKRK